MLNAPAAVQHPGQRRLAVRRHRHCCHRGRLSPVFTMSEREQPVHTAHTALAGKENSQERPSFKGTPAM